MGISTLALMSVIAGAVLAVLPVAPGPVAPGPVAPPDLWLCRWHLPPSTLCQPGATRLPSSAPTHVSYVHCRTRVCLRVCVRAAGAGLKFWMLEERAGASVVLFPRSFGTGFCTRGYRYL